MLVRDSVGMNLSAANCGLVVHKITIGSRLRECQRTPWIDLPH